MSLSQDDTYVSAYEFASESFCDTMLNLLLYCEMLHRLRSALLRLCSLNSFIPLPFGQDKSKTRRDLAHAFLKE